MDIYAMLDRYCLEHGMFYQKLEQLLSLIGGIVRTCFSAKVIVSNFM